MNAEIQDAVTLARDAELHSANSVNPADRFARLAVHFRVLAANSRDRWQRERAKEQAYMLAADQIEDAVEQQRGLRK